MPDPSKAEHIDNDSQHSNAPDSFTKEPSVTENPELLKTCPSQLELKDRAQRLIADNKLPGHFFILSEVEAPALIVQPNGNNGARLPVFTSPAFALDYMREKRLKAKVVTFKTNDISTASIIWHRAGIRAFSLDTCPRCAHVLTHAITEQPLATEHITLIWAYIQATRNWRMELFLNKVLAKKLDPIRQNRLTLEFLRDHVDCGNPYLHWMIGLHAGMEKDTAAMAVAASRLAEFGPRFDGLLDSLPDPAEAMPWIEAISRAELGLLSTYDMLGKL